MENLLQNNFDSLIESISYDKNRSLYYSEKYFIYFNHDTDCDDSSEGLDKIKSRYSHRINNFNNLMSSDKFIIFILFKCTNLSHVKKIYKILKKKHKKMIMFYIDCENKVKRCKLSKKIILIKQKSFLDDIDHWWLPENKPLLYNLMVPITMQVLKHTKKYYPNFTMEEKDIIRNCNQWYDL